MIDLSSFSVEEYLQEAGIPYSTSGKNVSENWVGISCPFCGDSSNHCGINIQTKAFSCWKCGERGRITKLISALENKSFPDALNITKKFLKKEKYDNNKIPRVSMGSYQMVDDFISEFTEPLCERDGDYLISRRFDPIALVHDYGLLSCKPTSVYTQRILIPYFIKGKPYTFSTRDVSGLAKVKYIHCPISRSVAAPKELLYNMGQSKDTVIVVEGVFDVFKIGQGSIALSGTQYTRNQILLLSNYKRIFILFDPEKGAQAQAVRLAQDLSFCSGTVEILKLDIDTDPGDMKEDDIRCLRKEIFGRIY